MKVKQFELFRGCFIINLDYDPGDFWLDLGPCYGFFMEKCRTRGVRRALPNQEATFPFWLTSIRYKSDVPPSPLCKCEFSMDIKGFRSPKLNLAIDHDADWLPIIGTYDENMVFHREKLCGVIEVDRTGVYPPPQPPFIYSYGYCDKDGFGFDFPDPLIAIEDYATQLERV